jgi:hypothetical protein
MGSVSGDSGADAQALSDLAVTMSGGENFVQRLNTLEQAKRANQAAYDQLKLGQDASNALADAQRLKVQAQQTLDDAGKQAAEIRKAASDDAVQMRDAATKTKQDADAYAAQTRSSADAYYQARTKEAEALKAAAVQVSQNADKQLKDATTMQQTWQASMKSLEVQKKQLEAERAVLAQKLATLTATLKAVGG